jgi:hypothetical protein
MKDLQLLVQLLSGVKVSKLNIIGTDGVSDTRVQQLYDQVLSGKIQNDEEGANVFFPDGVYKDKYFGKLKRRLSERLLNTLFFIDVNKPQFTDYQKANQVCHRNLLVVKLLLSYRQRHLAMVIAKKTFKKAVYFDFTEIALLLSKELRVFYSTITGEKEKAQQYSGYVKKYLRIYTAELKADEYYSELMVNYIFSKANKPELLVNAKSFCADIDILFENVDSYRFKFVSYLIYILRYEIENDYRRTLQVCEEALTYFTIKKHIGVKSVLFNFYLKKISCRVQLQEYSKAKEDILICLDLVEEGDFNWHVTQELDFLISLRAHDYAHAYDTYLSVVKQPNFKSQYQPIIERWKINEGFVHFLILKGKINPEKGVENNKFRINKFLNEVPKHSKDKRGVNITILVLQILFLLEKGRYEEIFERIEPLRMYSSRYLRKDDTFRSNCFVKMLMQLPAGHFHKEAVKRKSARYLKKLESLPLGIAKQAAELEIIPYEELWEYVLQALDNKVK